MSSDAIFVRGLEFEGSHGYTAAERKLTRRFRVDLELARDLAASARSDRIADTIDYRAICELVVELGTGRSFRLLERLAGAIADAVHERHPDVGIVVTVEKLYPPCPGNPAATAVRLVRPPLR